MEGKHIGKLSRLLELKVKKYPSTEGLVANVLDLCRKLTDYDEWYMLFRERVV